MLVIFYIVRALSAVLVPMFFKRENFKQWVISILVTITTGGGFCLPMIQQILSDIKHIDFGMVFAVSSLIAWQSAFIFLDRENLFNYEVCALLFTLIVCLMVPNLIPFEGWASCDGEHVTVTKTNILTSEDDPSQLNMYGEGFIVKQIIYVSSNNTTYKFSYLLQDGTQVEKQFPAKYTTICYIETGQTPYVEEKNIRKCSGYNPETKKHFLTTATTNYILYIPEGCVLKEFQFN